MRSVLDTKGSKSAVLQRKWGTKGRLKMLDRLTSCSGPVSHGICRRRKGMFIGSGLNCVTIVVAR